MSSNREVISVTLWAATKESFADERVRATVESAARALCEREGIELVDLALHADRLSATLVGPEIVGVGFASELRRATESWYAKRTPGGVLWGHGPDAEHD